ncbi:MAG TPA: hypothetical protein VIC34_10945 [Croceibacterium sp.]
MNDNIKSVVAWQVGKISHLLESDEQLPVAQLQQEAVELQVLLAEAAHQERVGAGDEQALAAE